MLNRLFASRENYNYQFYSALIYKSESRDKHFKLISAYLNTQFCSNILSKMIVALLSFAIFHS